MNDENILNVKTSAVRNLKNKICFDKIKVSAVCRPEWSHYETLTISQIATKKRILIWKTGHEIADVVASALEKGLNGQPAKYEFAIGYGILRGNEERIRECEEQHIPWFNADKGYLKPNHYDGYYRISLRGTQQTTGLASLQPDYARLAQLQIEFPRPNGVSANAHTLIVPPTDHAAKFFGINVYDWVREQRATYDDVAVKVRMKGDDTPLDMHLTNCLRVVTFNSSVGWEALRRGIPVYSDATHSIVGAYAKLVDKPLHLDFKSRRELFGIMASLQLTLGEISDGKICPLIDKLLAL